MQLYEVLSAKRKEKKMQFDELSEKSGVPVNTLKKIFTGVILAPSFESVRSIAYSLGMTLDDLDREMLEEQTLAANEISIIDKYRSLDSHGIRMVDFVLNEEYARCSNDAAMDREQAILDEINEIYKKTPRPNDEADHSKIG